MSFRDWVRESRERGLSGLDVTLYELYLGLARRPSTLYNYGTPIYEREWDVLLVLDGCRSDLMDEVMDEYDWLTENEGVYSVASASPRWMARNFADRYRDLTRRTAYVTGNPYSEKELAGDGVDRIGPNTFHTLDEVWKYAWDYEIDTMPADPMTDRAIDVWRSGGPDRMVVHYMQPHVPFVRDPMYEGVGLIHDDVAAADRKMPWTQLRDGETTLEVVWERYRDNLRYVLDSVERLVHNVDADSVVLTADHGNLVGELGLYGHPYGVLHPALRKVPWVEVTAENVEGYEPPAYETAEEGEASVGAKLEHLGYR